MAWSAHFTKKAADLKQHEVPLCDEQGLEEMSTSRIRLRQPEVSLWAVSVALNHSWRLQGGA